MAPTPLFTRDELAAAFALLLPAERADELATRWFAEIADRVDDRGRYVYPRSWGTPARWAEPAGPAPDWDAPEWVARDEATFGGFDDASAEDWLLRLSDLHLALAALVSDDLYARMREVRQMPEAVAARVRLQLLRGVRAYRRARGWPPAV